MDQNHFKESQCPQVLGSNRDGEKVAWAQAISGRDPGGRPVRGRVLNAQESKNRQKSDKKGFGNCEILCWQLKCKMEPCSAKSYGARSHMRFEHGHFFSVNWKNENVSFSIMAVTFRGHRLAGTYDPRRNLACQSKTKELQQTRHSLRGMRRL